MNGCEGNTFIGYKSRCCDRNWQPAIYCESLFFSSLKCHGLWVQMIRDSPISYCLRHTSNSGCRVSGCKTFLSVLVCSLWHHNLPARQLSRSCHGWLQCPTPLVETKYTGGKTRRHFQNTVVMAAATCVHTYESK